MNVKNLEDFKKDDWTKLWAGSWSFLTCSHFGNQYTNEITFGPMPYIETSIIFIRNGKSEGWARQADRDKLGKYLSNEIYNNPNKVSELCNHFRKEVDAITAFIVKEIEGEIDESTYRRFWDLVLSYYQPHINVKYVVDYLEPQFLEKYLPQLEEARLYAEPVFTLTEKFIRTLASQIGRKTGYSPELILCLTKEEMYHYFKTGNLPEVSLLNERNGSAAILSSQNESVICVGNKVREIELLAHPPSVEGMVKGKSAYPGRTQGIVRIVPDPAHPGVFNNGDILVAGMTRPEYLSLMKQASAFVTDAGGVLSHAAIVAREMKKPAVIGTQIATKVLHNGDLVEVDADRGMVTILKRA